jgi:putative nucleotidyltransferase with HDIG domain
MDLLTNLMDRLIQQVDDEKLVFYSFVNSRAVVEVLGRIKRGSGLEMMVLDKNGGIITGFDGPPPDSLKVFLKRLARDRLSLLSADKIPQSIHFNGAQEARMLAAPIVAEPDFRHLGYLLMGPYGTDQPQEDAADVEVPEEENGLLKAMEIDEAKKASPKALEDVSERMESYGRLMTVLYEERAKSRKNLQKMTGLYQFNSSIMGILDLEQILKTMLKKAAELLDADTGSVILIDNETGKTRSVASHGFLPSFARGSSIKTDENLISSLMSEGKPRLFKSNESKDLSASLIGKTLPRAVIIAPIKSKEQPIGILSITRAWEEEEFNPDDLEMVQALVSSTAAAVENAQLYIQLQKKIREFGALFDLSSTIVSTLERKEVLSKVLDNAIQLLHACAGSLMLLDPDKQELEIEVAHGLSDKVIKETKIPLGEGISGKVALEGVPRLLKKGIKEAESKSEAVAQEVPSALSVPMMFHKKVIGVLNVKEKSDASDFTISDMELLKMLANQAAIAIENARLHKSLEDLFINSIKALANAIEARDPYTRGHSERVTEYSVKIAEALNMEQDAVKRIRYAALLHDIGKINIKEEILNKPGKLTDEEYRIMNRHPTLGAKIMEPVKEFKDILPIMYHHHERFGAGGYPDGVSGEQIPIAARILAVADSFDAMTSDRPYRKALPLEVAVGELEKHSGSQFDPEVVEVFLKILEREVEWVNKTMESGTVHL